MKIKPFKSCSISIVKGVLSDTKFILGNDPITTVSEQPVKSLGSWYDAKNMYDNWGRRFWCTWRNLFAFPFSIIHINPFLYKSKTTSSERKNFFCELRHFYSKFGVSITRFWCNTLKCTLKQGDGNIAIVGHVQQWREGLGLTTRRPEWNEATAPEQRKMVVEEIRNTGGSSKVGQGSLPW